MANNTQIITSTWAELSHKILASILVDHGAIFPVKDILQENYRWFPPKDRPIYQAMINCLASDTPPTPEAVTLRVNGTIPKGYIQQLANQWDEEDNRRVVVFAQELRNVGQLAELRRLGQELSSYENPTPAGLVEAIGKAQAGLSGIMAQQTERDPSAESVSKAAWDRLANLVLIPTGLEWFDTIAGGCWLGYNYWVVAPYKSGKSTMLRNIALFLAEQGQPVGVFCAEGGREDFVLGIQGMIATRYLLENTTVTSQQQLRLSTLNIKRAKIAEKQGQAFFNSLELEALNEARQIYESLPIFAWDSKDHIKDLSTLRHKVKKYKLEYGCCVYWLDYSQLFGTGETVYERQSTTALGIQDIASTEDVALWAISQQSEEAVRGRSGSHSSGAKGGGDADAAADFLFKPSIDWDLQINPNQPGVIDLELHHSRWTASRVKHQHMINPASGLIVDKWYRR